MSTGVPDEMAQYLQIFLDESDEQLDELVQVLLRLEKDPDGVEDLNEAFRLIHSMKGSAGMMGFDNITALTHHLESRFERFRSGLEKLDKPTMNVVLRCIDYLRECVAELRGGTQAGSAAPLLHELEALDERSDAAAAETAPGPEAPAPVAAVSPTLEDDELHLVVHFEPGLPLADLKARLIVTRLSNLGDVKSVVPTPDDLENAEDPSRFKVIMVTHADAEAIRAALDVDGVREIELGGETVSVAPAEPAPEPKPAPEPEPEREPAVVEVAAEPKREPQPTPEPEVVEVAAGIEPKTVGHEKIRVTETMRVDIDRLDALMNLAGELVVNRARFVQVAGQVAPVFRKRNVTGRARDFGESLRKTIARLQAATSGNGEWATDIDALQAGLGFLEEQSEQWDEGRRGFNLISEAIDQLTRISDSLQQGVLETRMVSVAPLFNRFRRVVRDLSSQRGKKVDLVLAGEKTELDKRMVDELGDPLVHLVRNAIDHGIEPLEVREANGKNGTGTIVLDATHSGNSVFISIRDDGGGIDTGRIRDKAVERGLLSAAAAEELSHEQALEYIWHPGFSTAAEVTDISGRGVGMDAVRTRILELNGTIDVESEAGRGTSFTIRLPLTLAIINSLLVRIHDVYFSMPIDDVREIVSLQPADIVSVHGRETVDIRGEYLSLVSINDIFDWHDVASRAGSDDERATSSDDEGQSVKAVILHSAGRTVGLRVDELLGSQDIVIKSLTDNFVPIRGLSGASILGDGTVCLMLDVPATIDLAVARPTASREART